MSHRAFTLVELLVVVAIVAVLMALLIPAVIVAREQAHITHGIDNLKNQALASKSYNVAHLRMAGFRSRSADGLPYVWFDLLPHLDAEAAVRSFTIDNAKVVHPPSDVNQGPGIGVLVLTTPMDDTAGDRDPNQYAVISYTYNPGLFGEGAKLPGAYRDGASNTLLFGERVKRCGDVYNAWFSPGLDRLVFGAAPPPGNYRAIAETCDPDRVATPHRNVILVAMADGSAKAIARDVASLYWANAASPEDGTVPGPEW